MLYLKLVISDSISCMDHCSASDAALSGCESIIVLYFDIKPLGTICEADYQVACRLTLMHPIVFSLVTYSSRRFLCSIGYFPAFTLTGCFASCNHFFISWTLDGLSMHSLKRKTDSYLFNFFIQSYWSTV